MTQFKWNFEGHAATFVSTEASHNKDIFTAAKMLKIAPETKINYHDHKNNRRAIADTFSVNGDTTTNGESAVSVDTEKAKAEQEASELSDVHGDVDTTTSAADPVVYARDVDDPRNHLQPYWFSDNSVADDADGENA
jgi:hypothetical protein